MRGWCGGGCEREVDEREEERAEKREGPLHKNRYTERNTQKQINTQTQGGSARERD